MTITQEQAIEALRPVQDPELHRSIVDLKMVRNVNIEGSKIIVDIDLTIPGCPLKAEITQSVSDALNALDGISEVEVNFGSMSEEQLATLKEELSIPEKGADAAQRPIPFADPDSKTRILLIASGKGGVGKSSITANLAVALGKRGKKVAVVDADVWGFSIPRMLGSDAVPTVIEDMVIPPEAHGIKCISMGFFVDEDEPVIWRGPMLHKALEQFLADVFWDDPDYLVVDLPPGTGDIAMSLAKFLPSAEVIVVTTPQLAAQKVAQRAAYMARKVRISVAGVIENMSWFTGDDGKDYEIFGSGGGKELANALDVPLLAQIPLTQPLREGSDEGVPIVLDESSPTSEIFTSLAEKIDTELAPKKRFNSELSIS